MRYLLVSLIAAGLMGGVSIAASATNQVHTFTLTKAEKLGENDSDDPCEKAVLAGAICGN